MSPHAETQGEVGSTPQLPLTFDSTRPSVIRILKAILPTWLDEHIWIESIPKGAGIPLLKATNTRYHESVFLRIFGQGTVIPVDGEREVQTLELLAQHKLAPKLLCRFQNGVVYRSIDGVPAIATEFRMYDVSMAIARKLAEWHSILPVSEGEEGTRPKIWTTMNKWIDALPDNGSSDGTSKEELSRQFNWIRERFEKNTDRLVFSHCDLRGGRQGSIIITPTDDTQTVVQKEVTFMHCLFGLLAPAAFDIANHFAEWAGFAWDYFTLPARSQRRDFIEQYLRKRKELSGDDEPEQDEDVEKLMEEVDSYRGLPGFFWGVWALLNAPFVLQEVYDFTSDARLRLQEYWDWRKVDVDQGEPLLISKRESRWLREE